MESQKSSESQKQSKLRDIIVVYFDIVIRGLIAFAFIGILLSIFLIGFLKLSYFIVLPIAFICSILISPFLSKIKLGDVLLTKYENYLGKIIK
jgi:hypothetical protein